MEGSKEQFEAMQQARANNPEELEQFVKMNLSMEDYWQMDEEIRNRSYHTVETKGFDYSNDEIWCKLDSVCKKAYKERKKREFDITTNRNVK